MPNIFEIGNVLTEPTYREMNEFDTSNEELPENQMMTRTSNRSLDQKYNVKLVLTTDFFEETFKFLKEISYKTIFRFYPHEAQIFAIEPSLSHGASFKIEKTEMSDYQLKLAPQQEEQEEQTLLQEKNKENKESEQEKLQEVVAYLDADIMEDIHLNNRYPVEIFFDTIYKQRIYIINNKEIVSKRLNSTVNNEPILVNYKILDIKIKEWSGRPNSFKMVVGSKGFKNVLMSLERKKGPKSSTSNAPTFINVTYKPDEIDFTLNSDLKSSSILISGDDITTPGEREVKAIYNLNELVKLNKLKYNNNISLTINDDYPLVVETKYGSGRTVLNYIIAPRETAKQ